MHVIRRRAYSRSAVRDSRERSQVSTILPSNGRNFSSGGSWLGCAGENQIRKSGRSEELQGSFVFDILNERGLKIGLNCRPVATRDPLPFMNLPPYLK
jgi:hypothetical protein